LAGASPEEAVDAFLERIRATLACIVGGTAFGSGCAEGIEHSLTLYVTGQSEPNVARLTTHGGVGELRFRFAHLYTVVHVPDDAQRGPFTYEVSTSFYQYAILDYEENEVVVYDWAPAGMSPVRTPHVHVPIAGSTVLRQRHGSPLESQKTYLGNLHFPTGRILLEDIVELLIREFRVDPRRDDWEALLKHNREVLGRGRTW
jgi:hypothetical protein